MSNIPKDVLATEHPAQHNLLFTNLPVFKVRWRRHTILNFRIQEPHHHFGCRLKSVIYTGH